jgi:hypothetical protein
MHILCVDNPATDQPKLYKEGLKLQHLVYEKVGFYKKGTALQRPPHPPLVGIYGISQNQQNSNYEVAATVLGFNAQEEISIETDFSDKLDELRNSNPSGHKLYWGNFASVNKGGYALLLQALRISLNRNAHLAIIVVHTSDVPTYRRLGFAQNGFVKNVGGLENAPGHLMVITRKTLEGKFLTRVGMQPQEPPAEDLERRA